MTSSISSLRGVGQRVADGVHLDADDVARLEEGAPGLDGVVGAGQLLHARARRSALIGLAVLDAVLDQRGVADLDDAAGVGAGDAQLALERLGVPGRLGFGGRDVQDRQRRQGRRSGQELSTAEPAAGIGLPHGHSSLSSDAVGPGSTPRLPL